MYTRHLLVSCVFVICFGMLATVSQAETYYVRPDGGTAAQCTGLSDAAYPGSGTDQACAWAHPHWAITGSGDNASWRINGGDTLVIGQGSYMLGWGAPNTFWCDESYTYECDLPPLPSGPDADHPTRIVGKGWDQGCSSKPELWGTERIWHVLDLTGTSNAEIACLEITDHSGCVESHASASVACVRDTYPHGEWASAGIVASDSSTVLLKDLDIHGLAHTGIHAGRLTDWTVENVRIAGNGWVGWDGDIHESDSNSGTMHFKGWTVEWNGCAESYPDESPSDCWGQPAGGYGDGVGTGATGGNWIIEDSIFRYNTSDGLDLLYVGGEGIAGSSITVRRSRSYGNAGDQIKLSGPSLVENSLMVSNCGYFEGKSFAPDIGGQDPITHCRAGGSAVAVNFTTGANVSLINNTITGQGDCLGIGECRGDSPCDGSEVFTAYNNIFRGRPDFTSPGDTSCFFWFDQEPGNSDLDYNLVYEVKTGDYHPSFGANSIQADPMFMNDSLDSFDGRLQPGSPALDSGAPVGGAGGLVPSADLAGKTRPQGAGVDRGAYEGAGSSADTDTITGWWWDSSRPGKGVSMELQGEKIYAAVYDYDSSNNAVWRSALCNKTGSNVYSGTLKAYSGSPFLSKAGSRAVEQSGTMTLTKTGEQAFTCVWSLAGEAETWNLSPYLPTISQGEADSRDLDGWWWDPAAAGSGAYVQSLGKTLYAAMYHYRADGSPVWWFMGGFKDVGGYTPGATTYSAHLYEMTGTTWAETDLGEATMVFKADGSMGFAWNGQDKDLQRYDFKNADF